MFTFRSRFPFILEAIMQIRRTMDITSTQWIQLAPMHGLIVVVSVITFPINFFPIKSDGICDGGTNRALSTDVNIAEDEKHELNTIRKNY